MSQTNTLSVAQEGIAFQGDTFFKAMVGVLEKFPRDIRRTAPKEDWFETVKNIAACIKKYTGLTITVSFENTANMFASSYRLDLAGAGDIAYFEKIDASDITRDIMKQLNRFNLSANVDLKKSYVTGSLSDFSYAIGMNPYMFLERPGFTNFTDEELSALILHEVGHIFTSIEMLDRTVATNQVLAEMVRQLSDEKQKTNRETIIRDAAKKLSLEKTISQDFISHDNAVVTEYLLTAGLKRLRTQSGHSFYDMNTWEMLADQFAARHGAARPLATCLDKMIKWGPDLSYMSARDFFFKQVIGFGISIAGALAGAMLIPVAPFVSGLLFVFSYLRLTDDHRSYSEPNYDDDRTRLIRIRNNYIQIIKSVASGEKTPFAKTYIESLKEDVQIINSLLENTADNISYVTKLKAFFSSNEANRIATTKFQKDLEELAHNQLYAKSLALKSI